MRHIFVSTTIFLSFLFSNTNIFAFYDLSKEQLNPEQTASVTHFLNEAQGLLPVELVKSIGDSIKIRFVKLSDHSANKLPIPNCDLENTQLKTGEHIYG